MTACTSAIDVFPGDSALHALIRTHDWSLSALGEPSSWPLLLRHTYRVILDSPFPMSIAWGPHRILLYNEAYIRLLGGKHPEGAFALPVQEVWSEIWSDIGPLVERSARGDSFYIEDFRLNIRRHGQDDPSWFTVSYSPVKDDEGRVCGICNSVMETTSRVMAENHQTFLVTLTNVLSRLTDPNIVMREATMLLGIHLKANRVHYAELDFHENQGVFHAGYTDISLPVVEGMQALPHFGPLTIAQLARGEAVVIDDVQHDPAMQTPLIQECFSRIGVASFVAVPLAGTASRAVVFIVNCASPRHWKNEEVELIRETGEYTWSIIQKVRAENEIRRMALHLEERVAIRTEELEQVRARQAFQLKMADRLRGMSDPLAMCREAASLLGEHFQVSRVLFGDYDFNSKLVSFHSNYTDGTVEELNGTYPAAVFGHDNFGCLEKGLTWIRNGLYDDPLADTTDRWATFDLLQIRSGVVVPLSRNGKMLACLFINDSKPRVWHQEDIALIEEVAERTWNAIERARAEDALRETDRRKDQFLAMLAHELRNPLAPISAAAEWLKLVESGDRRIAQTSEVISRQVAHMSGLVDDLLDVSRVTRGLVVLKKTALDAKQLLREAIEQVRPLIETRRHALLVQLPAEPVCVLGDKKRLVQVMTNLLNNAAKYTPESGEIRLRMYLEDDEVVIAISDNGLGMDPVLVERAFELFAQAERTADRSQGGLGIGLALVKSLLALHEGSVTASSEGLDKGSCFTVRLPCLREEIPSAPPHAVIAQKVASRSLTVLVVDDNRDAARMLALYVEALGHRPLVEYESRAAIDLAIREAPDVCLLDIGLPDIDGNALARRLRGLEQTRHSFLIAVTGYGREQDKIKAQSAGFDHHFVKPLDVSELAELLNKVAAR